MDGRKHKSGAGEEMLEDHEAEIAAEEAEDELRRESAKQTEAEYRKMAADLRWETLEYLEAHPDKTVAEAARRFGLKEGTIRAWKAHVTMGTYAPGAMKTGKSAAPGARQRPLFEDGRKKEKTDKPGNPRKTAPSFFERKRFSNFIHYFDKTPPGIVCPHFYILAHANGCAYGCDYCYLKLTLRHYPEPTVFSNTARMFQEMRDWLLSREEPSVMNAGELCDALCWDRETGLARNLVPLFAAQKRHKLLFLTKSAEIENLLSLEPTPQVIVSFSVNAPAAARQYEKSAPPPEERLKAAARLQKAGWEVRLRLDPMIPVKGWREAYARTAGAINEVNPSVVTLGSLRYFRSLTNHGPQGSDIFTYAIDHNDPDGRLRVPRQTRLEMYQTVMDRLSCLRIGLCKETEAVHKALGLPGARQSCNCTLE